ncbi:DUF4132 domain-containing protein [Paenibacillus mucilaginosus]|uniref:DUF4132 domain-containing protein n=1 Tax=Paenibacillus mucilaginosus (strain KNP414) TaxID=1036673 RepID=F8FIY6_PAEMK|nr:DUF4132 domain-containing protein [Paenibacillus mucilaginosus]AEI46364.1 hypothetical protein KNP414_07879 [Paenibacillus mucilaginosus KNP414]MCG7213523.1 DUF4132 domain-containing protein [Paenibacillus mucilaginosus]WDM27661.1 DUF4132 domain-containing protein [Paenibacillus mucilaginosus]
MTEEHINAFEALEGRAAALSGPKQELALAIIAELKRTGYTGRTYLDDGIKALHALAEGDGSRLLDPLAELAGELLGSYERDVMAYILAHQTEYPYTVGYYRRPLRTTEIGMHRDGAIHKLVDLAKLHHRRFRILDYLTAPSEEPHRHDVISDILAYELDRGNDQVLAAVKGILYGDNNTALLNRRIIKGLFLCHLPEAYQMMGDMLIAARLQEGLRQSIVETVDEGTLDAMVYMLDIIVKNDFGRFSSVERAFNVWTGLGLGTAQSRVLKLCLEYAQRCLADEELCEAWSRSSDVLKLYLSLWATGMRDESKIPERIHAILDHGEVYQKAAALYYLDQSQNNELKYEVARHHLDETDPELQALLITNYAFRVRFWGEEGHPMELERTPSLEDAGERRRQFGQLKSMLLAIPQKEMNFPSRVFEWLWVVHSTDAIARKMMYLAAYAFETEFVEELIALQDHVSPDVRDDVLKHLVKDFTQPVQRAFVFECLADKSMTIRETALAKLKKMKLAPSEVEIVEGILKLKTGALRQSAITILLGLEPYELRESLERLLGSGQELQRLGGLEVLCQVKEDKERLGSFGDMGALTALVQQPTKKERTLLGRLSQQEEHGLRDGFGLFDPAAVRGPKRMPPCPDTGVRSFFTLSAERIKAFLGALSDLVHEHREHEYEVSWYSGNKESVLVGTRLTHKRYFHDMREGEKRMDGYPLADVWNGYLAGSGFGAEELLQTAFYCRHHDDLYRYYTDSLEYWREERYKDIDTWGKPLMAELYPVDTLVEMHAYLEKLAYAPQVLELLEAYVEDSESAARFAWAGRVLNPIVRRLEEEADRIPEDQGYTLQLFAYPWLGWLRQTASSDASFAEYFAYGFNLYTFSGCYAFQPDTEELARAYELGLVSEEEIYQECMIRKSSGRRIGDLTDSKLDIVQSYPSLAPLKERMIRRILDIELNRGDLATEVTRLALSIRYMEGMDDFVALLSRLDRESFIRGYIYGGGEKTTRKESLSYLLRICHPKEGEGEQHLRDKLQGRGITEKRLLEAAMYAPQWLDIIAKHLKWEGLRSAAWYFHAHINETFSAEKETVVAHYSPIASQDFNDGAFDVEWFKEAYGELGEERFGILYDCAKYISAGANHRRSQLFADAVLGRLDAGEMSGSALSKRNKDHLLCYSLIPLGEPHEREGELLRRYEFIHRFLKESKKFGAQRRASEAKAGGIALDNLARNAGYPDVIRMTWDLEAKKIQEMLEDLEPQPLDDLTVRIAIDDEGTAELEVTSKGKVLKSVPAKYKKHERILELREKAAELRSQYKRAKEELERSMTAGSTFTGAELAGLMTSPVIAPLLRALVFEAGGRLGFYAEGLLEDPQGVKHEIAAQDELRIAHPVHLLESGSWGTYQKHLFDRAIRQPFKQVFRELYVPNPDELAAGTLSRRYAGHQIQPRKAAALLKSRSWTASYEEGLQKVYYKENIIARVYALADWFSPSEVESPTLETVGFFHRRTYEPLDIGAIPPLIFSEVMRDVDLVVSVAHAGAVDPEASLTTIELRRAIVAESLRLLKITNVRLEGNFALIAGSLGEYSVHLGSGMAYKMASGALYIIPVHSQHRGRIFLPFMDEDPKTAEILSKITMLAQDTKLKDPSILAQLTS